MAVRTKALVRQSYKQTVLRDNPVAYWRLGEASGTRAASEIGANFGTYTGGVTLAQAGALAAEPDGTSNTAALFDGATGYVISNNPLGVAAAGAFTFECWVKYAALGAYSDAVSTVTALAVLGKMSVNTFWFGQNAGGGFLLASTTVAVVGTWYHIAGTYDGATARIYVNGVLENSVARAAFAGVHGLINIGRDGTFGEYFNGTLDEAPVYTTALSATRLLAHYTAGLNQAKGDVAAVRTKATVVRTLATARTAA